MSRMRTPWTPRRSASCVVSKYPNSWPQANCIQVSPVHCSKMELKRLKAIGHAPIADCEPLEVREVESTLQLVLNSAETVPLSTINLPKPDSSKWMKLHLLSTMKTR